MVVRPQGSKPGIMPVESESGMSEELEHEETVEPRQIKRPTQPTRQEYEEHMITHIPFRDWCPHCVRGKALGHGHENVRKRRERGMPVVAIDYMWMKSGMDERSDDMRGMPILVIKDGDTGNISAYVVPEKGAHWFAIKILKTELEYL